MNNQPEEIQQFIQQQIQAGVLAAEQEFQRRLATAETEYQGRLKERFAAAERDLLQRQAANRPIVQPGSFSASPKEDVEQWLYKAGHFLTNCRITTDIERITIATQYFSGAALTWWRSLELDSAAPNTWEGFEAALLETFKEHNKAETARDRLAAARQVASVKTYATLLRNLKLEIPHISDDEIKDRFIRGLKRRTQEEVRMREPATFEQAVKIAERYDSLLYRTNINHNGRTSGRYNTSSGDSTPMDLDAITHPNVHPSLPRTNGGGQASRSKLSDEERQRLIKEGKCFRCRQTGHISKNCPLRREQSNHRG
jgi:hypothetical protein